MAEQTLPKLPLANFYLAGTAALIHDRAGSNWKMMENGSDAFVIYDRCCDSATVRGKVIVFNGTDRHFCANRNAPEL